MKNSYTIRATAKKGTDTLVDVVHSPITQIDKLVASVTGLTTKQAYELKLKRRVEFEDAGHAVILELLDTSKYWDEMGNAKSAMAIKS